MTRRPYHGYSLVDVTPPAPADGRREPLGWRIALGVVRVLPGACVIAIAAIVALLATGVIW